MRRALPLLALLLAASGIPAAGQDIAFRGWGLRAGIADNPDQFVFGAQFDFGEFLPALRFQPHLELGVGDDQTILSAALPVHYRHPASRTLTLYGGGGLAFGFIDRDLPEERRGNQDDSDIDIAPLLAGGLEWPVGASRMSLELNLTGGDLPRTKLLVGWMF